LHGRGRVGAILGDCGGPFLRNIAASSVKKGLQKSLDPGSNPGPGPDMDLLILSRYPFLPEAREHVANIELDELFSVKYEDVREYAKKWIESSFQKIELPLIDEDGKLLAFYVAKLYLIAMQDPIVIQRFANYLRDSLEEYLTHEEDDVVESIASSLGIRYKIPNDEVKKIHLEYRNYMVFRMVHFIDFVKYTSKISGESFRLINYPLKGGWLPVSREIFIKILREAFVSNFVKEIKEKKGEAKFLRKYVENDIREILQLKDRFISQYSSRELGEVESRAFPPCIRSIIANLRSGVNLPHQARFFLVTFLHRIGMKNEEILKLFATAPDFREDMTRYQIEHITGKISGKEYDVPKCETLKAYGLCLRDVSKDRLCEKNWMTHPLLYYKLRKEWLSKHSRFSEGQ